MVSDRLPLTGTCCGCQYSAVECLPSAAAPRKFIGKLNYSGGAKSVSLRPRFSTILRTASLSFRLPTNQSDTVATKHTVSAINKALLLINEKMTLSMIYTTPHRYENAVCIDKFRPWSARPESCCNQAEIRLVRALPVRIAYGLDFD